MKFLALVVCIISPTLSANILGIFPLPSKSHFVMFERLFKKLAEVGHNVDVATHFPSKEVPPRYNQLSLLGSLPIFVNNITKQAFENYSHYDFVHFMVKLSGVDACAATLKTPALQNLKSTKTEYDLVITEIFGADCMLGFGHFFNVPTVSLTSSINLPWGSDRFGNPDNPAYIPTYFATFTAEMSLYERIENTIILLKSKFLYSYFSSKEANAIAKEFFGPDLPSLEELAYNTSLLLVNSHYSMNYARPTVPNFIEVGGLHIHEPKPLSPYFESLLTKDINQGVVYLTMGSMVMTETFDTDKLQGMFDAFAELPYKVLWKAVRENFAKNLTIPKNIHFEKWMPQIDILCHPNVKLFISHGGLMGSQEATYCGVPRLGIPIFADQDGNVRIAEKMNLAIKVDYNDINKKTILDAVHKLLTDSSFKLNAERVAKQFKDRPMSPLDTAVFWVEYVMRHEGAPQLRSVGAKLYWYQYYLLDVIAVLALGVFAALFAAVFMVKFFLGLVRKRGRKEKAA